MKKPIDISNEREVYLDRGPAALERTNVSRIRHCVRACEGLSDNLVETIAILGGLGEVQDEILDIVDRELAKRGSEVPS